MYMYVCTQYAHIAGLGWTEKPIHSPDVGGGRYVGWNEKHETPPYRSKAGIKLKKLMAIIDSTQL